MTRGDRALSIHERSFAGCVDRWDGRWIGGWAIDRSQPHAPCEVDVYADGRFLLRTRADNSRPDLIEVSPANQDKGFLVDLGPTSPQVRRPEVLFGCTTQRVPPIEALEALVGPPRIDLLQRSVGESSRWLPMPPAPLIRHITGAKVDERELVSMYRRVGFTVAADIYNMALELGADPHRSDFAFVDLGCGCGRIATFLAQMLDRSRYLGVDVWIPGIKWATKHISSAYPAYRFQCLVKGRRGYEGGQHHRVPVDDATIDCVIATSLFTHLDLAACASYLREIGRILTPGGLAYATFFLLDEQSIDAIERMSSAVGRKLVKETSAWHFGVGGYLDIIFDLRWLQESASAHGLEVELVRKGAWRGAAFTSVNPAAFQDLLVLRKV